MFGFFEKKKAKKANEIVSPVNGKCIALDDVKDDVFSQHMLGDGVAFEMTDDMVGSPAAGTITMVADTYHAFGIEAEGGFEVLVHVGLETVALNGKGMEPQCKVGDKVNVGDPLLKVDLDVMKEHNIDLTIPVIFTNGDDYEITISGVGADVSRGESVVATY